MNENGHGFQCHVVMTIKGLQEVFINHQNSKENIL